MQRIREIRLSFVWFERLPAIWQADAKPAMPFLLAADAWGKQFEAAVPSDNPEALTLPWPPEVNKHRHWFWTYYLRRPPETLKGTDAFSRLVPLRTGFASKIKSSKTWTTVLSDGFFYPHGTGLAITLKLFFDRGPWPKEGVSIETAVQKSVEAWAKEEYSTATAAQPALTGKLDEMARLLRKQLRERALGPNATAGAVDLTPFSVASVVRGNSDFSSAAPPENGDVHRALQGLCSFRLAWQDAKLYPMNSAALRIRRSDPDGHVLYHADRSRTIWFPSCFREDPGQRFNRSVGCYHRNLTLLHLQLSALIEMLRLRDDLMAAGNGATVEIDALSAEAANQVAWLYGSTSQTYRSSSPRTFIDEHEVLKDTIEKALGKKLTWQPAVT